MSKVIIYQTEDGCAVMHPAPGKTPEECLKHVPEGAEYKILDADKIPNDRYFRRAWRLGQHGLIYDLETAKEVQRDKWRKLREKKFAVLDLEVMKAVERGDAKRRNTLADQKQALRDVTETPLPDTLDEIRNTIPEILLP